MSAASAHLTLRPDRCNQCGACVTACPNDAVRVGDSYVLVDWRACNQCLACVDVCGPQAIQRAVVPLRSTAAAPSVALGDVAKVVVGSRAEAKAVRKAATQAAKQGARGADKPASSPLYRGLEAVGPVAAAIPVGTAAAAGPRRTEAQMHERVSGPGARWGLFDAVAVLLVLLVTLLAKNAALGLPQVALIPPEARGLTRAAVLAAYYLIQVGALVVLASRHRRSLLEALGFVGEEAASRPQPTVRSMFSTAALTVGLLLGVEIFAVSYGLLVQALGWKQPLTLSTDVSAVFGGGGPGLVLSVLLVAIVAPVAEEFAFRGVILSAFGERWGVWPSVLASSALFAAYHVNAWMFVPMLVFGVALGWLVARRGSLWPAIALHVLYNALAVAAAFLVPR